MATFPAFSTRRIIVPLAGAPEVREIFGIDLNTTDNGWELEEVTLEILDDPIAHFNETLGDAIALMDGRGVAFGTDINGFAAQMPFTRRNWGMTDVAVRHGGPPGTEALLATSFVSSRPIRLNDDGIAHYGMLPDVLQAVSLEPGGDDRVDVMFRSAENVIQMWEAVIAASSGM